MHQHGGDIYSYKNIIDFSANINDLGMPETVRAAAIEGVSQSAAYPDVKCRALKKAISERDGVKEAWIFCGNGAADVIYTLVHAIRPKKALLPIPSFYEYEQALDSVGCQVEKYRCKESDGFLLGMDYVDLIREDTDIIFLCNPNNPTGTLLDPKLLDAILEKCQQTDTLFVLDECFVDFLEDWELRTQITKLEANPKLFIMKAFTKMYAMAGLRLGYGLCADGKLLQQMENVSQPWRVSIPAMSAGLAAVGETQFAQDTRVRISKNRKQLQARLCELGFKVYEPAANFIFFQGAQELSTYCLEHGCMIRDCSNYEGLSEGFYRIAVKSPEENEVLLRVFESFIHSRKG